MHKVLVVGCGGSGAKTLAYMMDQLKTTLAERLPDRYDSPKDVELPRAWQFVSVDVPTVPERPDRAFRLPSSRASRQERRSESAVTKLLPTMTEIPAVSSMKILALDNGPVARAILSQSVSSRSPWRSMESA